MLGELIGQCTGKVTGIRVLPTEGQYARLEVSLRGEGRLVGQPITDFGAHVQTVRPGGMLQGEAHVEGDGSYRWQMWEWTGARGPEAVGAR